MGHFCPEDVQHWRPNMASNPGLTAQPSPATIVPQGVKTPPHVAPGKAPEKSSTIPLNGVRPPNKSNGPAPTSSVHTAKTKPASVNSTDSKGKVSAPQFPGKSGKHSPSGNSDGENVDACQTLTLKSAGHSGSINPSDTDRETETRLVERIETLWSQHQSSKASASMTRDELKRLRDELSIELHSYKFRLVGTGRNGRWAEFLRERGIRLSTADKWVKCYAEELARKEGKILREELKPPTAEEISRKVNMLAPGLRRFLRTPEPVPLFLRELGEALNALLSAT
jgi:hypothetical protein